MYIYVYIYTHKMLTCSEVWISGEMIIKSGSNTHEPWNHEKQATATYISCHFSLESADFERIFTKYRIPKRGVVESRHTIQLPSSIPIWLARRSTSCSLGSGTKNGLKNQKIFNSRCSDLLRSWMFSGLELCFEVLHIFLRPFSKDSIR